MAVACFKQKIVRMEAACCPVCNYKAEIGWVDNCKQVTCPRCGHYRVSNRVLGELTNGQFTAEQIANISGWIKENQGVFFLDASFKGLVALRTPTVGEKAEKILRYLARGWPVAGKVINIMFRGRQSALSNLPHTGRFNPPGVQLESFSPPIYSVAWAQSLE